MKVSVVAYEQPDPEGTAAGRALWAWCEGVIGLGHELEAWSWYPAPPKGPLPEWCRWQPLDHPPLWRGHLKALVHPRNESASPGWEAKPDAVAVADDVPSYAAVAHSERSVVTVHYRALPDARAVRRLGPPGIQTSRAERRAGRQAALVLAFSERVGRGLRRNGRPTRVVPIAYPAPPAALPLVEEPVAALIADWSWRPNNRALTSLLSAWPAVHDAVPGARLLLAGRHLRQAVGTMPGVEVIGEVGSSIEVLGRAAVIAFPCPPTSGPKVKVLEAMAHGVPVVTTPAGVEGLVVEPGEGAMVASRAQFGAALIGMLLDPERRAAIGAAGRQAAVRHHDSEPVARARLAGFESAFG
ncbi:MAG TPA: glycosyltransferase family 4 protein [Acidimicrobiales bacterium]|nr:glycosyltransferase family 4 protein [Acidimicrobiales bacterium]